MKRCAAIVFVVFACGGGSGDGAAKVEEAVIEVPYGEPFDLRLGERAIVAGEFRLTFERVAEESRCPKGAECVQAGNAAAAFGVESHAGTATLTLNTDREPGRAAAMGGELRLVELAPRPHAQVVSDTSAYVATLIVSPAP